MNILSTSLLSRVNGTYGYFGMQSETSYRFRFDEFCILSLRFVLCMPFMGPPVEYTLKSLWMSHEKNILNANNLAPSSIYIFSGIKLITSNFIIIQMMGRVERFFLSHI